MEFVVFGKTLKIQKSRLLIEEVVDCLMVQQLPMKHQFAEIVSFSVG